MSKTTGYVTLPVTSYNAWKNAVNGNGFDVDYPSGYGCQCYDLALLFWNNVGFPQGYPLSTGLEAYGIWTRRNENISYNSTTYFDLVTNLNEVKQGDILVYNGFSANPNGHIGWADQDYASWHERNPTSREFPILSQNNGGTPDPDGGSYTNIHGYDTQYFLGAFRYKEWQPTPPPPPVTTGSNRSRLPLILMTRRINNPDSML